MKHLLAVGALVLCLSKAGAALDLQSFGSAQFLVDPDGTSASYTQTANSLVLSRPFELGVTVGGLFSAGAQDWSLFSTFGLRMTLTGTTPDVPLTLDLPFTVQFLGYNDADPGNPYPLINEYTGTTLGLGSDTAFVPLTLSASGTGDLSGVFGLQFTWDGSANNNVAVELSDVVSIRSYFTASAPGGVRFINSAHVLTADPDASDRNYWVSATLPPDATSWSVTSDSNAKTEIAPIDHRDTLRKVAGLPVSSWQYKHDPDRRYVGPMAQEFHAAFGLGSDDRHISTLDTDGVVLSAIKGLIEELEERKSRSADQMQRLKELQAELERLKSRVSHLPPGRPADE